MPNALRNMHVTLTTPTYCKAKDRGTGQSRYIPYVITYPSSREMCRRMFKRAADAEDYGAKVQERYVQKFTLWRKTLWIRSEYDKLPWYRKLQWKIKKVYYEHKGRRTILSLLD